MAEAEKPLVHFRMLRGPDFRRERSLCREAGELTEEHDKVTCPRCREMMAELEEDDPNG